MLLLFGILTRIRIQKTSESGSNLDPYHDIAVFFLDYGKNVL